MNTDAILKYLGKIPSPIIELVENLDNDQKWAVYVALIENEKMYFSQMKELFGANPSEMDRILKSLIASGLVVKRAHDIKTIKDNKRTYYEITSLGQKFFDCTFDLVIPQQKNKKTDSGIHIQDQYTDSAQAVIDQISYISTIQVALRQE
jgi:DNA-binding MarR family transcriptional regulator